jgi:hypothetical protein
LLINKYERVTPGLRGFKPEVLQTPQPLARPGRWEATVPGPCTKECCSSTKFVTGLPEKVV